MTGRRPGERDHATPWTSDEPAESWIGARGKRFPGAEIHDSAK